MLSSFISIKIIVFFHKASLDELEIHWSPTEAVYIPEKLTQKGKDAATFNSFFNLSERLQIVFHAHCIEVS